MLRNRKLRALLGLLLAFMLLAAACGDDSSDSDEESSDTTGATDDTTAEASDLTVGMVYDLGGRGDQSFNDSAAAGLDQAVEEFGIEAEELEPDEGGENRQELLQLLCDNGTDLIFAVGFLYSESVRRGRRELPGQHVRHRRRRRQRPAQRRRPRSSPRSRARSWSASPPPLTTETDHVGFIGGVEHRADPEVPGRLRGRRGGRRPGDHRRRRVPHRAAGLRRLQRPRPRREVATSMYEGGADVVYAAAGGSGGGVFEAAVTAREGGDNVWAIGVDSDQYNTADPAVQDVILTSMLKRVDVAVYETIADRSSGNVIGGRPQSFDLSVDGVGYSTSGGFLSRGHPSTSSRTQGSRSSTATSKCPPSRRADRHGVSCTPTEIRVTDPG